MLERKWRLCPPSTDFSRCDRQGRTSASSQGEEVEEFPEPEESLSHWQERERRVLKQNLVAECLETTEMESHGKT